ncbi:MAG: hypothetical protein V3T72_20215 [Thermoanaerobaculia bacterium]
MTFLPKISSPSRKAIAVLAALAAWSLACGGLRAPDLGRLYNRPAQHHGLERNPVIVIPGILGSKLVDAESGKLVWGAFFGGGARPQTPEGARFAALPMRRGAELDELRDGVVSDGVLERFKIKLVGLRIQMKAYIGILSALGAGGFRDEDLQIPSIDYGDDHFTCFQFDYDFRRDNVENARRLHDFILERRAFVLDQQRQRFGAANEDLKFDVIAHSMGGLILRYYLRYGDADLAADGSPPAITWAGARHVAKAVLISPPNAGGTEALSFLVEGRRFGRIGPRYDAAVLSTYPSMFQLLPRVRHQPVIDESSGQTVDFMDPKSWEDYGWGLADPAQDRILEILLDGVADPGERRRVAIDHLRKSLVRARRFHAALDVPAAPPAGTDLYLMAGDAIDTPKVLAVDRRGGLRVTSRAEGDGRVLRSSALMDERIGHSWLPTLSSPIDWTHVTFLFREHLDITHDPVFTDNLLYLLLEAPASPRRTTAPVL